MLAGNGIDRHPQDRDSQHDIQCCGRVRAQPFRPRHESLCVDERGTLRQKHFLPAFGRIDLGKPRHPRPTHPRDRFIDPADLARRANLVIIQLSLALQQIDGIDRRGPHRCFGERSQILVLGLPAEHARRARQIADPAQPLRDRLAKLSCQDPAAAVGALGQGLASLQRFDLALQPRGLAAHARHGIGLAHAQGLPQHRQMRLP